jgi:hypothetical protein
MDGAYTKLIRDRSKWVRAVPRKTMSTIPSTAKAFFDFLFLVSMLRSTPLTGEERSP